MKAGTDRIRKQDPGEPSYRGPVIAGLATIFLGLGGLTTWAFSAHLDSAAVASATVVVDSKRKTISHLEGGILKTLLAHEGEVVKAGEPLLRLDDTRAKGGTRAVAFEADRPGSAARSAAGRASRPDRSQLSRRSAEPGGPTAAEILSAERQFFMARREMFDRKVDIQRKTIEQQMAELQAVKAQTDANTRQAELLDRELKASRASSRKAMPRVRV